MTPNGPQDWRKKSSQPAQKPAGPSRGAAAPAADVRDWRKSAAARGSHSVLWGRLRLLGVLGLLLSTLAYFVFMLLVRPQPLPILALAISNYELPLPPNAFAHENLLTLVGAQQDYANVRVRTWSDHDQPFDLAATLQQQLAQEVPGGPGRWWFGEKALVVYIAAHGTVDAQGEPCLLVHKSTSSEPTPWPVRELLQLVANVTPGKPTNKLIVLEAGQLDHNWRLGIPVNRFARRVDQLVAELNLPRLAVLQSNGFGETSAAAPELNATPFGHFFAAGVRGAADLAGNGDHRVSVQELARYLQHAVGQWAIQTRGRSQTPVLSPASSDFALAAADVYVQPAVTPFNLPADVATLDVAWKEMQVLDERGAWSIDPLAWGELQQQLQHWERLVRAGRAYDDDRGRSHARVQALLTHLRAAIDPPQAFTIGSLPQLGQLAQLRVPSWREGEAPSVVVSPAVTTAASLAGSLAEAQSRWRTAWEGSGDLDVAQLRTASGGLEAVTVEAGLQTKEQHLLRILLASRAPELVPSLNRRLLLLFDRAFLAEAPADPRASLNWLADWSRDLLKRRQELFDRYLSADVELAPGIDILTDEYQSMITAGEHLSAAYAQRDRIMAESPYWLEWALDQSQTRQDDGPLTTWKELWESTLKLDEQLVNPAPASNLATVVARVGGQTGSGQLGSASAARLHNQLVEMLLRRHQELLTIVSQQVNQQRAEIVELIELPLPGIDRPQLRQRVMNAPQAVQTLLTQFTGTNLQQLDAGGAPQNSNVPDPVTWYQRHLPHPALQLLAGAANMSGESAAGGGNAQELDLPLAQAEKTASTLVTEIARRRQTMVDSLGGLANGEVMELRRELNRMDGLARRIAYFNDAGHDGGTTGIWRAEVDRYQGLMDAVQTELAECWGPEYFELAGQHYLQIAREIAGRLSALSRPLTDQQVVVQATLDQLAQATRAGTWEPLAEVAPVIADDTSRSAGEVQVRLAAAPDLPAGQATVRVTDEASSGSDLSRRMLVDVRQPSASPLAVSWRTPADDATAPGSPSSSTQNVAQTSGTQAVKYFFRGHERVESIITEEGLITLAAPHPASARVVVKDAFAGRLVLVLDCSGSMGEAQFKAAQKAIVDLLDSLRNIPESQGQIAVFAYGHRNTWLPKEQLPPDYKTWVDVVTDKGLGVHPSADVEQIIPAGPLTKAHIDRIKDRLAQLTPKGLTPLYLSVRQALDEMAPIGDEDVHIIVITDGEDKQDILFANDNQEIAAARRTTIEQVLNHPGFRQARVDICLYGQMNEQDVKFRDLKRIDTAKPKNQFVTARTGASLYKQLLGLVLGKYRLAVGNKSLGDFQSTGTPTVLPTVDQRATYNAEYEGVFADAKIGGIRLEGGEAVEINYRAELRRLEFGGFNQPVQANSDARRELPANAPTMVVRVHDADEQPNGNVTFRISLQNLSPLKFTQRPTLVWAEVRPIVGERPHVLDTPPPDGLPVFYFMDRQFEVNQPSPVLRLSVKNWPRDARFADVRLRLSDQPVDSFFSPLKLDLRQAGEAKLSDNVRIGFQPAFTPQGPGTLTITEFHGERNNFPLLVLSPQPFERVAHTFLAASGQVRHVYRLPQSPAPGDLAAYVLRVTTPSRVTNWVESGPLLVQLKR